MKIAFHGAARTVTGSKHLITLTDGRKILLDCGMFQGMGVETRGLNEDFGFEPSSIDILLLSHAHIDHTGLVPRLVKEGFSGRIICTDATKELTGILLHDSAEIQTYDSKPAMEAGDENYSYGPLYDREDVETSLRQFETVDFNVWFTVMEGVDVMYTHTGHLPGSAAITLRVKEGRRKTTILYTGDIGRYRSVLLQSPVAAPPADYIIMESTYGDKHHDIGFNHIESLRSWIKKTCIEQQGKLIIPAFSVGRTQEVLFALNQMSLEKTLPDIPYFIDSPLSLKATQTIKRYTGEFNERLQQVLMVDDDPFEFPGLKYIETVEDSRKLASYKDPCVIISASGTADAGRVRHHISSCIEDSNNAILFVGYCGTSSTGGRLLDKIREVELFNQPYTVQATIGQLQGMSAHGDVDDLVKFLANQNPEKLKALFLVHAELNVQQAFAEKLSLKGFRRVELPSLHQEYELPLKPRRKRIPKRKEASITNNE